MLLKSITICCLMLNVQTQVQPYYSQYNTDPTIYYPDQFLPVIPLSATVRSPNKLDNNAIGRIVQNRQPQKIKPSATVEIQKSHVTEVASSFEQVPSDNNWNNLANGQISTPITPSRQIAQQFGAHGPTISQAANWQPAPQTSYDRQSVFQGTQAQSKPAFTLPPNSPQSGQTLPQRLQAGPSVALSQNGFNRPAVSHGPAGRPIASKPPPSSSDFNFPTERAPGYNELLYSVTDFGVNMLKTIDGLHQGNVVVSPFSITLLLGLLQQGASGQTQAQITQALHMQPEITAAAYYNVSEGVRARNSRNILRVANNVFVSDNFGIEPDFKTVAVGSFNSEVTTLSFSRAGEAARQINSWVASRTDNHIEQLIAPDAIDYSTQIVLVNAIYFKGLWEVPFRVELTSANEFHLSNGQTKTVPFMRMRKLFRTGKDKATDADVIVLPFEGEEYQLMVVLPSRLTGMRRTLASLTDARLLSYLSFHALDTELVLPKFKIRADTDLAVVLKTMNVTDMFRRDYSELGGIGHYGPNTPHISSAVHSAFLSIDEKGGTAAAATAFAAVALSYDEPDMEFKVNRPFIAVLWDDKSSLPLFMAKIEDPLQ